MPTPVGHALGGLLVGILLSRRGGSSDSPSTARILRRKACPKTRLYWWTAIAASLPDLDFLWGRHNMETHSLGFALLVGVGVLVWSRSRWLALASTLAVGTHVLFDWLGSDDFPPLGVMALWPLSTEFYFANAFVFEAISRRYWLPNFYTHNLLAVLRELVILLPPVGVAWWLERRRARGV